MAKEVSKKRRRFRKKVDRDGTTQSGKLMAQTFIIMLILVLLGLLVFFIRKEKLYHAVIFSAMDVALILSLLANWLQLIKIKRLVKDETPSPKKEGRLTPSRKKTTRVRKPVDPKLLPDPGLVYRFDLTKSKVDHKLITIGQTEGSIKTYSTEILNDHLQIDIRIKMGDKQDIYETSEAIVQNYQIDLRRGARVMIYYPGMERFREMDSRERILLAPEADGSGDFQFPTIDPKNPIRFQLGDRLRHDGKFLKGYMEFHLFCKETEIEVGEYTRKDKVFFLRIFKIFPGYDTAHPTEDGLYPMIDPYLTH